MEEKKKKKHTSRSDKPLIPKEPGQTHRKPSGILSEKQQIFVDRYMKTGNGKQSAIDAGYAPANAHTAAFDLVNRNKNVRKALEAGRTESHKKIGYDITNVMEETSEAISFAKETGNANAYVKAVELRAKVQGLIVDKLDVRSLQNFQINIVGLTPPQVSLPVVIKDVTYQIPPAEVTPIVVPPEEKEAIVVEPDYLSDEAISRKLFE